MSVSVLAALADDSNGPAGQQATSVAGSEEERPTERSTHADGERPIKKARVRIPVSCDTCIRRKRKCSRTFPCTACVGTKMEQYCKGPDPYAHPLPKKASVKSVKEGTFREFSKDIQERFKTLEESIKLARDVSSGISPTAASQASTEAPQSPESRTSRPARRTHPDEPADKAEKAAIILEVLATGHPQRIGPDRPDSDNFDKERFALDSILQLDYRHVMQPASQLFWKLSVTPAVAVEALYRIVTIDDAKEMVDAFLNDRTWSLKALHGPSFKREFATFCSLGSATQGSVDPAWLALLCGVLVSSATVQARPVIQRQDLYELTRTCLELANWQNKPQIRCIQTLLLLMYCGHNGGTLPASAMHEVAAMRLSQSLGLHELGPDSSIPAPVDKALPTGTALARETCVRIWYEIVGRDWMQSSVRNNVYHIQPRDFNTGPPSTTSAQGLDDGDNSQEALQTDDEPALHLQALVEIADLFRRAADLGLASDYPSTQEYYDRLMILDADFRKHVANCGVHSHRATAHWASTRRLIQLYARRLRLHRIPGFRGYQLTTFAYSTRICMESAQSILMLARQMKVRQAPVAVIREDAHHVMTAVVAIFVDILNDMRENVGKSTIEAKLSDIPDVLELFEIEDTSQTETGFYATIGSRVKILTEALVEHVHESTRTSNLRVGETEAQTMKRITEKVHRHIVGAERRVPELPFRDTCASSTGATEGRPVQYANLLNDGLHGAGDGSRNVARGVGETQAALWPDENADNPALQSMGPYAAFEQPLAPSQSGFDTLSFGTGSESYDTDFQWFLDTLGLSSNDTNDNFLGTNFSFS